MKKQLFFSPIILFLVLAVSAINRHNATIIPTPSPEPLILQDGGNHDATWMQIDTLIGRGLRSKALSLVDSLYPIVKGEVNVNQMVKCAVYRIRCLSDMSSSNLVLAQAWLKKEIEDVPFPVKELFLSARAEVYRMYLYVVYPSLRGNKEIAASMDLKEWTVEAFNEKIMSLYEASMSNVATRQYYLKDYVGVFVFNDMLENTPQATLYDFLAWRTLDYIEDARNSEVRDEWYIDDNKEVLLAPTEKFLSYNPKRLYPWEMGGDENESGSNYLTTSQKAISLFQDLTRFHLQDTNQAMLQDIDMHRIKFMVKYLYSDTSHCRQVIKREMKRWRLAPIYTEWAYLLAEYYYNSAYLYNHEKSEDHYWDFKIANEIISDAIYRYPKSYGAKHCENLRAVIEQAQLSIESENAYPLNKPMLMQMSYQNTLVVYHRLVYLNENQYDYEQVDDRGYPQLTLDRAGGIAKLPIIKSWGVMSKNDGSYRAHYTEIKVDAQKRAGRYMLLSSTRADFDADKGVVTYTPFYISDIAYVRNCQNGNWYVFDRNSGKPMPNVKELIYIEKNNINASFRNGITVYDSAYSDANGLAKAKDYYYDWRTRIRFSTPNDYLNNKISMNGVCTRSNEHLITSIYTDRAIYRPGQTVYFKGLVIKSDSYGHEPKVHAHSRRTIAIRDVTGREFQRFEFTTNAYGAFDSSFVLPTSGLLGVMHIFDVTADNEYYRVVQTFRVEEYKRPKFEVSLYPVNNAYALGEEITIKGKALAFAGNNIDNATIRTYVQRSYVLDKHTRGYRYQQEMGSDYIDNQTLKTKPNGDIEFKFNAKPLSDVPPNNILYYNYKVVLDVVDVTGETHSVSQNIKVGSPSALLDMDLPEQASKSQLKAIKISSLNLNGGFEPIQGAMTIERLVEPNEPLSERLWAKKRIDQYTMTAVEFKANFPTMAYRNENDKTTWPVQDLVFSTIFDTKQSNSVNLPEQNELSAGTYKVTLSGKDKYGAPLKQVKYVAVFDLEKQKMPANCPLLLNLDKSKYAPNDVATLSIGSSFRECWVLYKIVRDDKVIDEHWVELKGVSQVKIPILETYRGGCSISAIMMKNNRLYKESTNIYVPFTNKELKIEYMSFRDKLAPGQEEEWQIKISGEKGEKVVANLLANLYDASLDAFLPHEWNCSFYDEDPINNQWIQPYGLYGTQLSHSLINPYRTYLNKNSRSYPNLNWYDLSYRFKGLSYRRYNNTVSFLDETGSAYFHLPFTAYVRDYMDVPGYYNPGRYETERGQTTMGLTLGAEQVSKRGSRDISAIAASGAKVSQGDISGASSIDPKILGDIPVRANLNELVFFKPDLRTDTEGNIIIKFKMNEALTRWRLMLLAITEDLQIGYSERFITTQKDLMVVPNAPRFLREGDNIEFAAKVNNISASALSGEIKLELYDAATMQPIDNSLGNIKPVLTFTADAQQSTLVKWNLNIPENQFSAITYRVIAQAGDFSDGEENLLPIVTNRMLVTETMPLPIRGGQTKSFEFKHMTEVQQSKTAQANRLSLEFTSNPAWYAVQSLSYLMEYPYECTEQLFSRFYGNALAAHIINSSPKIREVFNTWQNYEPDALGSKLLKNQELKNALLEETPWVLQPKSEAEQKKRLALLFDLNRMSATFESTIAKLIARQNEDGSFTWFGGDIRDLYITQHIIEGLGHLEYMGIKVFENRPQLQRMVERAIQYCDAEMIRLSKDVAYFKVNKTQPNWSWVSCHYLYARSFYTNPNDGHLFVPMDAEMKKWTDLWMTHIAQYWHLNNNYYGRALWALAAYRQGNAPLANEIMKSIKAASIEDDEMGIHLPITIGYCWYESNIESHALILEAFNEITHDTTVVEGIKTYLIKNKQTTAWATTKATTAATYALLMTGNNWLAEDKDINITLGNTLLDQSKIKKEAGTGYFKTTWEPADIKPEMAKVKIENPNKNVAWGAMYWQYFEQLDKITSFKDTPLKLNKQLFRQDNTDKGPLLTPVDEKTELHVGDLVKVRIELFVDRDMEYVQLKDMRASCFEPTNVLSGYSYQGGLGHYESTRDLSTSFFIGFLPKGDYVFEYPLRVTHRGDFSNGVTTIQCMYAPEFTSHSSGIRVQVK